MLLFITIIGFLINVQVQGNIHISGPPSRSWLVICRADLIPDLQVCLSWVSISDIFHSLQSLSVSCCHVISGLSNPCLPSTCMSKAVLTAPLEHSIWPYQWSLLSFRMSSKSSMPSCASSSLDLVVTMSCSLTLQICLIIALSFRCRHQRFGFVISRVSLAWSIALHTQELFMGSRVLKERWREERTKELVAAPWTSSRRFSHLLWLKVHSHRLLRTCLLGSKRKLPSPACQIWWTSFPLWSAFQGACSLLAPCTICNQGPLSRAWAHCISCSPSACSHFKRCCPLQFAWKLAWTLQEVQPVLDRSWSLSFLHLLSVLHLTVSPFSSVAA